MSSAVRKLIISMYNDKNAIKLAWEYGYVNIVDKMVKLRHEKELVEFDKYTAQMNALLASEKEEVDIPEYLNKIINIDGKKEEKNIVKKGLKCPICLETNNKAMMFDPCGHVGVCSTCSENVNKCIICNKKVFTKIQVIVI